MAKLKFKGKELKQMGYPDDTSINLALKIISTKIKRGDKSRTKELLREILFSPSGWLEDPNWKELAQYLQSVDTQKQKSKKSRQKAPTEYAVYGLENIDPAAIQQMETAMKMPVSIKGALMADAHVGYGLPIGGVVATYNAVMPYGVGMDIGCRMCMSVYPMDDSFVGAQKNLIKKTLSEQTRFGHAEFKDIGEHPLMERKELSEIRFLRSLKDKFYNQLGTSGHGNHFVDAGYIEVVTERNEMGVAPGRYFAVLSHSGSRNFGAEVARHYTRIAKQKLNLSGESAKLAWLDLDSEEGQEYWLAMNLAGDYSAANHHIIHQKIAAAIGEKPVKMIENHHNFAWKEKISETESVIVHRKGATPAHAGVVGIIPGSMTTPAYVVIGKGNADSLHSAAHGAGRVISRRQAKRKLAPESLHKLLDRAGVELIGGGLDESPEVYKNIDTVMEAQKDLVDVLAKFYPKIVRMA